MNHPASVPRRPRHRLFAALAVLLIASLPLTGAAAASQSPEIVVRELFSTLLAELDARRAEDALTPASAREVFARLLNPRIDYNTLSRWILRDHWANSTEEQRGRFLAAFKDYIINTYSLALSSDQKFALDVEDLPTLRKNTAIVDAAFTVEDADAVPLQFRMISHEDHWYLFDVSFAGVSLALTFRSDFNYVADDGGIEAVTAHLIQRAGGG